MIKQVIIGLSALFLVSPLYAKTIKNEIKIETNTGGNTVNGEVDGESVTTGSTSTSINVTNDNNFQTSPETSKQTTESETNISIEANGSGNSQVEVSINDTAYEVSHANGETVVTTIDSEGKREARTLETNEEIQLNFSDGTTLEIIADSKGFNLTQGDTHVVTALPIELDIENEAVSIQQNQNKTSLTILPEEAKNKITQQLSELHDMIALVEEDNQLVYRVEGIKKERLLSLFPIRIKVLAKQSAVNQSEVDLSYLSWHDRLLDRISW